MAQRINRLTDRGVRAVKTKGLFPDGGGLHLQVSAGGSKSWVYRFKLNGRARDMGLGGYPAVSLERARQLAKEAREQRDRGLDPIEVRDAARASQRLALARATTFRDCAEQLIASHEAGWRNARHRQQWRNTLVTYVYPVIGDLAVSDVTTDLVLKVLEPIWVAKTETASRVRGRIEGVLSWAKARGMRTGENPATWRGHLDQLLPRRSKVRSVEHHPALEYHQLPEFMARLRQRQGITPRTLEFTILTAARTCEALGAKFEEFDLDAGIWLVPAARMKAFKEHRVALSSRAVAIAKEMAATRLSGYVFPGMKPEKPLSDMAMLRLAQSLHTGTTIHGFRSAFKDWAAEATDFPDHVSEAALAHVSADKVRKAYARGDLFEKRRQLMEAWSEYCEPPAQPREPDNAGKMRNGAGLPIRAPILRGAAAETN